MSAEIHVLKFLTGKYKGEEFPSTPTRTTTSSAAAANRTSCSPTTP
ncbi:hypothetical protein [Nannocystis pusilla]